MTGSTRYRQRRSKHLPAMSETAWMQQLTELAVRLGWQWLHVRSSMYGERHFLTATSGPLGRGWPDLLLIKPGRMIAAELKRRGAHATDDQLRVLAALSAAGVEAYVWWPDDFDTVKEILSQ